MRLDLSVSLVNNLSAQKVTDHFIGVSSTMKSGIQNRMPSNIGAVLSSLQSTVGFSKKAAEWSAPVKQIIQMSAVPFVFDIDDYRNQWSEINREGDLNKNKLFRDLVDPIPSFITSYQPSQKSFERCYGKLLQGARCTTRAASFVFDDAKKQFERSVQSSPGGISGSWHMVKVRNPNWTDFTNARKVTLTMGDVLSSSMYNIIGGKSEPLVLFDENTTDYDPVKRINSISFNCIVVELIREWYDPLIWTTPGWTLDDYGKGWISTGECDNNTGIIPLIPSALVIGFETDFDVEWKTEANQNASLGAFPLDPRKAFLVAVISDLVPFAPNESQDIIITEKTEERRLIYECVRMLDKYYDRVKCLSGMNILSFDSIDMNEWKTKYYPKLVQTGIIRDGDFFQNSLENKNYGIGDDGSFCRYEYVGFLYWAYKALVRSFTTNQETVYIKHCIDLLEPFVAQFENKGTSDNFFTLPNAIRDKWQSEYYKNLSLSGKISDGDFFGDFKSNPDLGIGADGTFSGVELLHFLFECYRAVFSINTAIVDG
jgi:hypothetical protein